MTQNDDIKSPLGRYVKTLNDRAGALSLPRYQRLKVQTREFVGQEILVEPVGGVDKQVSRSG